MSVALGHEVKAMVVGRLADTLGTAYLPPWDVTMWLLHQRAADRTLYEIARTSGYRSAREARTAIAVVDAAMSSNSDVATAIWALLPDVPPLGPPLVRKSRAAAAKKEHSKTPDYIALAAMRQAEVEAQPARKRPADRVCLRCGVVFESKWCGNRLCEKCS